MGSFTKGLFGRIGLFRACHDTGRLVPHDWVPPPNQGAGRLKDAQQWGSKTGHADADPRYAMLDGRSREPPSDQEVEVLALAMMGVEVFPALRYSESSVAENRVAAAATGLLRLGLSE